jgi:hypothetical protein
MLMTAADYRESLRAHRPRVFVNSSAGGSPIEKKKGACKEDVRVSSTGPLDLRIEPSLEDCCEV